MDIYTRKTWRNSIGKYAVTPLEYIKVDAATEIPELVRKAESRGFRLRAVGSGHSFSDVALTGEYLIDVSRLNQFLPLPEDLKSDWKQLHLVHAQAGMTIRNFNKGLDKQDLAIINMGGIDHQTLAGAISTGTHGTGIRLPPVTGMVRSISVVVSRGRSLRIEPADGPTDPALFQENGVELIQDDDSFDAMLINLGCMGIIHAYLLEVRPMYKLEERKFMVSWQEARKEWFSHETLEAFRGVMIQINPYVVRKNTDRSCLIVTHRETVANPLTIWDATRNWISGIFGNLSIAYRFTQNKVFRRPHKLPNMIESSLRFLRDERYINRAHRVLYQGFEYLKERAYDCEFAFQYKGGRYLEALESTFKYLEDTKRWNLYQSSPFGIRFVGPSRAAMAPFRGNATVYIDTPFILGTPGADQMLDRLQEIMIEHGGIPHWGKINNRLDGRPELIRERYPQFDIWRKAFEEFNSSGVFTNNFSDRLFGPLMSEETYQGLQGVLSIQSKIANA